MNKKIIAMLAAAACCATMIQPVFAASNFKDITGNQYSWCASQIKAMADAGYINGVSDTEYAPDSNVTNLQSIVLFARAMGSRESENSEILDLAHQQYDDVVKSASIPEWGMDEVVYMLYKGALSEADLVTYLKGEKKDAPMNRGDVAVIITKGMNGETAAKNNTVKYTYKDAASIPSNKSHYVQYVTDMGIMNGITDENDPDVSEFQANGTVTRAQMAVMLYRAVDKCDYSFVRSKLAGIDEDEMTVTIKESGEDKSYKYNSNTRFTVAGIPASLKEFKENLPVVIQFSGDEVVSVEALSDQAEETISAIFQGYNKMNGKYQIKVRSSKSDSTVKTYTCAEDVPITYQGSPATIQSLKTDDPIELSLSMGQVVAIVSSEKTVTITGATVENIAIDGDKVSMTISSGNPDYDGKTYEVADDAVATKSSKEIEFSSVYVGDKVNLTVRYGKIIKADATATYSSVTGTIKEVIISNTPSITVRADGKEKTYQVPTDCIITVNQKEGSLYDFRVGDNVVLTTQSSAVTKIQVSTSIINDNVTGVGSINGRVAALNTAYGFVSVLMDGYDQPIPVYKTSNNTTVITSTGKTLDFKSIKSGDTVECRGNTTNGAFVATLIIVTQAD